MASPRKPPVDTVAAIVLDAPDSTVLDLLDNLLNKGVMANGDVTLGVAGVDLIYLRLSALLCASDRVEPQRRGAANRRQSRRRRGPLLHKRRV
jgi:DNA polymerase II large subunit